jgi:hypothetical protein
MSRRTPRIGMALLRLVHDETVVGDLVEEFEDGRGRGWFTLQAIGAVIFSAVRDLRAHPILTLRGVAVTLAALFLLKGVFDLLWDRWLAERAFYAGYRMFGEVEYQAPMMWMRAVAICPMALIAGWTGARLHPVRHTAPLVLTAFIIFCLDLQPIAWSVWEMIIFPRPTLSWFMLKLMTGHLLFAIGSLTCGWRIGSQRGRTAIA